MLRSSLESAMAADEPRLVPFEDLDLQIHFRRGASRVLVIIFHGAVDQVKRKPSFFQPDFEEALGAHQLTISDPSLALSSGLEGSLDTGGIRMGLQEILPRFFQEVAGMRSSTQAGRSLMRISGVTNDLPRPRTRSLGTRNALPVRRQAVNSRRRAPRPCTYSAW